MSASFFLKRFCGRSTSCLCLFKRGWRNGGCKRIVLLRAIDETGFFCWNSTTSAGRKEVISVEAFLSFRRMILYGRRRLFHCFQIQEITGAPFKRSRAERSFLSFFLSFSLSLSPTYTRTQPNDAHRQVLPLSEYFLYFFPYFYTYAGGYCIAFEQKF